MNNIYTKTKDYISITILNRFDIEPYVIAIFKTYSYAVFFTFRIFRPCLSKLYIVSSFIYIDQLL